MTRERAGGLFAFTDLLIIAASPVVVKAFQDRAPLWAYTTLTLVPSAIFLWLLRPRQYRAWFRRDVFPLLLANSLIGSVATFILFYTALRYTTATNGALVEQIEIAYSLLIAVVILRERISWRQALGTVLIVAASLTVLYRPDFRFNKGEIMMLIVPLGFQVGHAFAKRLLTRIDAVEMAAGRQVFTTVIIGALALAIGRDHFRGVTGSTVLALAGIGMIFHAANGLVWFAALSRMGLAKATAIVMAYPVLTAVFEWALTRQAPPTRTLAALGIVVAALAILMTTTTSDPSFKAPTSQIRS